MATGDVRPRARKTTYCKIKAPEPRPSKLYAPKKRLSANSAITKLISRLLRIVSDISHDLDG